MKRDGFAGWLRNVDRKAWSLEVPYQEDGVWKPMFPDMLIVRKSGAGFEFDILEPHDDSRKDNIHKAKGLALFAERHGDKFKRIQMIRKKGDSYVRLEMNKSAVQTRVRKASTTSEIDSIFNDLAAP